MMMADATSFNDDDDGAEEDKAAINFDDNKREDLAMRLLPIGCDNATTMMDARPPLLACRPSPCQELPLQRDGGTLGAQNAAATATTTDKFGITACAMASRGAITNAINVVADDNNNANNDDGDNQC